MAIKINKVNLPPRAELEQLLNDLGLSAGDIARPFLRPIEVTRLTDIPPGTLADWRRLSRQHPKLAAAGKWPPFIEEGRTILYPAVPFLRWLRDRMHGRAVPPSAAALSTAAGPYGPEVELDPDRAAAAVALLEAFNPECAKVLEDEGKGGAGGESKGD